MGYLTSTGEVWPAPPAESYVELFREGLRQRGYIEGRNIIVEYRFAHGDSERLHDLVEELVRIPVDMIVLGDSRPIRYARAATQNIPLVMVISGDPHLQGIVDSLRRPGGNLTGLSISSIQLDAKRLELIKDVIPAAKKVAVLWERNNVVQFEWQATAPGAEALGIELQSLEIGSPEDLDSAIEAASTGGADAILVFGSLGLNLHAQRIAALALARSIPLVGTTEQWVEAGALMTYAPTFPDLFRRAGEYVDKILTGADPAELPIEEPTRFDLIVTLATAEAIGIEIPSPVMFRATRIIR